MPSPASSGVCLSVVTATRSGSVRLPPLIKSLQDQDLKVAWEWVVVMDGVTDQTPWVLKHLAHALPVRELLLPQPTGVATALAAGYEACAGSVILRCDDDLTLPPNLLSEHWERHERADRPLGVISMTRDVHDSRFGEAYGRSANDKFLIDAYACDAEQRWRHWAACNSVSRDAYDDVGGFDTTLTYREDSDLGYRLSRAGVHLIIDPALEVAHRGTFSHTGPRVERAFVSGASLRVFEETHPEASRRQATGGTWSQMVSATARLVPSPAAAVRFGNLVDSALPVLPAVVAEKAVALAVESAGAAGHAHGRPDWTRSPEQHRRSAVDRAAARLVAQPGPLDGVVGSMVAVATDQPQVVLTYDDGPTPGVTDRILDVLERHGQTATFFVLANRAASSPHLLREVQAAGHEVAVHGPDHQRLTRFTATQVYRRTLDAKKQIEDICGVPMRWFRPPYGDQGLRAWTSIKRAALQPVLWSATFSDHLAQSHEERLRRVIDQCHRGAIVLAHDGYAGPMDGVDDGPEPIVDRVRLSKDFLDRINDLGLTATSVGDGLKRGVPVERAWLRS